MAVMGLKINQPSGGLDTSVADTLAKALFGDPEREMKMALARRQYETEAYQQQLIQAQTANAQAAVAKAQAETADKVYQTSARQEAGNVIAEQQAGLLEPPVPVEVQPEVLSTFPARPGAVSDNASAELPAFEPPAPVEATPVLGISDSPYGSELSSRLAGSPLPRGTPSAWPQPDYPDWTNLEPQGPLTEAPVPVEDTTQLPETPQRLSTRDAVMGVTPEAQAAYDRDVAAVKARVKAAMAMGQSAKDIAEGMGVSEGMVRMLSEDPEQQQLGTTLYTGNPAAMAPGTEFNEGENKLRAQYQGLPPVQRFDVVNQRFKSMKTAAAQSNHGVGDTIMIYDMIKMADPTSSVMGGEQVTAANAPGLLPAQMVYFNNLLNMTGDKFNDEGRQAFIKAGYDIWQTHAGRIKEINDQYTKIATEQGARPENIIYPLEEAADPNLPPPGITEDQITQTMANNPNYSREQAIKLILSRMKKQTGGQ